MTVEKLIYVVCNDHGRYVITEDEYQHQLNQPEPSWVCPICGEGAKFDGIMNLCINPDCDELVEEEYNFCTICGTCQLDE